MQKYSSEGILKNNSRKFGLFTGEVTINYVCSDLIRAFLQFLSHVICGGSIGSENYGTSSLYLTSTAKSLSYLTKDLGMPVSTDHY